MELVISCMPVDTGFLRVPSFFDETVSILASGPQGFFVLIILVSLLVSRTVCDGLASFGETVNLLVLGRQFLNFRPSGGDELVIFL